MPLFLHQPQSPPGPTAQTKDLQSTESPPPLTQDKDPDLVPEEQGQNPDPEAPAPENLGADSGLEKPDPGPDPEPDLDKKGQIKPGYKVSFVKST